MVSFMKRVCVKGQSSMVNRQESRVKSQGSRDLWRTARVAAGWFVPTLLVAALLFAPQLSAAQTKDYPTIKGNNGRTGDTGDAGPGPANLRWFHPDSTENVLRSLIVDNTT